MNLRLCVCILLLFGALINFVLQTAGAASDSGSQQEFERVGRIDSIDIQKELISIDGTIYAIDLDNLRIKFKRYTLNYPMLNEGMIVVFRGTWNTRQGGKPMVNYIEIIGPPSVVDSLLKT